MTQTGKCDTCRLRKVKCDEERPKCGACRKKDRPCTYSYGKASAFVVQDPNQFTKHGKSKIEPVMYTLDSIGPDKDSNISVESDLRLTSERHAENGRGFFQTLTPVSKVKTWSSKKKEAHQRKVLESHLRHLQEESALVFIRPLSPETTLIARYIDMLGPYPSGRQPLSILGTWIRSIPSRIGSSRMLDLAVKFFINSHAVYMDETYSKRRLARSSKAKALRELQLLVLNSRGGPSYEILLATKMHYAAEALMGIDTMYHAIHAFGLAELLKSGSVSNADDEHYWNLIDNTYADDVNEALLAGRKSVFDNDFYLSSTYPTALDSEAVALSAFQRASTAVMHVLIQCPRLVCLVRHAILNPEDTNSLASAVSLAETLWAINLPSHFADHLNASVTVKPGPIDPDIGDLLSDSLEFNSVQSMNLCTRYWTLRITLCGLTDTLYRYFPVECSLSLLPSRVTIRTVDIESATQMAKSLPWAESVSANLPLVPLRLHSSLQVSIAPWHRMIRNYTTDDSRRDLGPEIDMDIEISRAKRMKKWLFNECNRIHDPWHVSKVEEKPLLEALDTMAGEKIPEWLPVRVRFEAEDGEMVIKLDYENRTTGNYQERYEMGNQLPKKLLDPNTQDGRWQEDNITGQELAYRPAANASIYSSLSNNNNKDNNAIRPQTRTSTVCPVDFIHSTGRNLCSTSGWWPDNSTTATIPLDSTHNASDFPQPTESHMLFENADNHALSWWPQSPTSVLHILSSDQTPQSGSTSPAWSVLTPREGDAS